MMGINDINPRTYDGHPKSGVPLVVEYSFQRREQRRWKHEEPCAAQGCASRVW